MSVGREKTQLASSGADATGRWSEEFSSTADRLVRAACGLAGLCESSGQHSLAGSMPRAPPKHSQKRVLSVHCGPELGERSSSYTDRARNSTWLHAPSPHQEQKPDPVKGRATSVTALETLVNTHCSGEREQMGEKTQSTP